MADINNNAKARSMSQMSRNASDRRRRSVYAVLCDVTALSYIFNTFSFNTFSNFVIVFSVGFAFVGFSNLW